MSREMSNKSRYEILGRPGNPGEPVRFLFHGIPSNKLNREELFQVIRQQGDRLKACRMEIAFLRDQIETLRRRIK